MRLPCEVYYGFYAKPLQEAHKTCRKVGLKTASKYYQASPETKHVRRERNRS